MKLRKLKKQNGFTLVEMLIVVAIIAILIAVSIPMVQGNLEKSRNATDMANVRAAKAVATIDFMSGANAEVVTGFAIPEGGTDNVVSVYYDASTGKCVATTETKPTGYGKSNEDIPDSTDTTYGTGAPKV